MRIIEIIKLLENFKEHRIFKCLIKYIFAIKSFRSVTAFSFLTNRNAEHSFIQLLISTRHKIIVSSKPKISRTLAQLDKRSEIKVVCEIT